MAKRTYVIENLTKEEYDYIVEYLDEVREREQKRKNDIAEIKKVYTAIKNFLRDGGQINFTNEYGDLGILCDDNTRNPYDDDDIKLFLNDLNFYYNEDTYTGNDIC